MTKGREDIGQVLVLTALCLAIVLGFVVFAVDVGLMLRQRRIEQTAADSAALAGPPRLAMGM